MIHEKVYFDKNDETAYLETFVADPLLAYTRKAILIIPGGGYCNICAEREGEPIAMAFLPHGYSAFVLHYSVYSTSRKKFPTQLIQASMAMKYIRDHAQEFQIDPEKIFVTGFSAGGHLAASLGIMWDRKEIYEAIDMPYGYNKPAGIMPIYPVISAGEAYSQHDTIRFLWGGEEPTEEQKKMVSLEKYVTEKASPAYIVHTSNDELVDVKNSLALAEAYANAGLTFELHIYPKGVHGLALGNEITAHAKEKMLNKGFAKWIENAVLWAEGI